MSSAAQELIGIVDGLPEDKAREVVDFARFLQQQAATANGNASSPGGALTRSWNSSPPQLCARAWPNRWTRPSCDLPSLLIYDLRFTIADLKKPIAAFAVCR